MPLPILPIAAVALTSVAVVRTARALRPVRIDQRAEDALDATDEGLGLGRAPGREQSNASARFRRVFRWREDGPGVEVDLGLLARFRVRKV
jgi:hypothetical protein